MSGTSVSTMEMACEERGGPRAPDTPTVGAAQSVSSGEVTSSPT